MARSYRQDGRPLASASLMAIIGQRYKYMFEAALIEQGSGDGLFEGCKLVSFLFATA